MSLHRFAQQSEDDLLEMPIAKQGWAKFFIFDDKGQLDKLQFFENQQYHENKKIFGSSSSDEEGEEEEESDSQNDDYGPIDVPARDQFYFILNKLGLYALSSRRNDLTKTQKTISMNVIKPIIRTKKGLTGGLEDIGNFREGFCFKVVTESDESWIMCCSSLTEKE